MTYDMAIHYCWTNENSCKRKSKINNGVVGLVENMPVEMHKDQEIL